VSGLLEQGAEGDAVKRLPQLRHYVARKDYCSKQNLSSCGIVFAENNKICWETENATFP